MICENSVMRSVEKTFSSLEIIGDKRTMNSLKILLELASVYTSLLNYDTFVIERRFLRKLFDKNGIHYLNTFFQDENNFLSRKDVVPYRINFFEKVMKTRVKFIYDYVGTHSFAYNHEVSLCKFTEYWPTLQVVVKYSVIRGGSWYNEKACFKNGKKIS